MTNYLLAWAATALCILAVDAIWLGRIARDFYFTRLDALMREKVLIGPAALFYLLYSFAVVILAVRPDDAGQSALATALLGGMVGLAAYGTYNLTNYSTLKGWPFAVVATDIAAGTVITAAASLAGHAAKGILA